MFEEMQRLQSPTGALLAYRHQPASGDARGILLVCHGLAEHSRRYRSFAEAMAARGWHVYAHDHRGHGETQAPDAPIGRFARRDGVALVVGDVMAMHEAAASAHPGLPIILFGHSMGGLISLRTVVSHPKKFDAVAVWNSNLDPGLAGRVAQWILRAERMLKGSDVPSGLLPKLTFGTWAKAIPNRRTEFDWLSRDEAKVDAYVADPLCGFDASTSLWLDIFDMSFAAAEPTALARLPRDLPIHLAGGGQDPATDNGRAVERLAARLKAAGFSHITLAIDPEARHETLNEPGAERAIAAFADWCDRAVIRHRRGQ